jgi:competence protein ComEC
LTLVLLALCINAAVWYAALREDKRGQLTVSFLNIGQGDAIFIDAPSGRQMLIDGGPDSGVLRKLSEVMPWYDRSIDIILATHPDADHITGLIDVLERYRVDIAVDSSVQGSTAVWQTLKEERARARSSMTAQRGQVIDLGAGTYVEILYPDRPVPGIDTNDGSIVAKLIYGDTSFMFTGDAPQSVEKYLVALDGGNLHADVLKAGHHGSKTSSATHFVGVVAPGYAVFSRGCDNKYGHPSKETVDVFARFSIPTVDTCERGTITFVSDGKEVRLK